MWLVVVLATETKLELLFSLYTAIDYVESLLPAVSSYTYSSPGVLNQFTIVQPAYELEADPSFTSKSGLRDDGETRRHESTDWNRSK